MTEATQTQGVPAEREREMPSFPDFPAAKEEVTAEWLSKVLRANGIDADIEYFTGKNIGTGQLGDMLRCTLNYRGGQRPEGAPATLICKLSSSDPTSRQTGVATGIYQKEATFYRELAPFLRARGAALARCYAAEFSAERRATCLVFDDLAPAEQGDQLKGCSVEEAELGVLQAARIHAALWESPVLKEKQWLLPNKQMNVHFARMFIPKFLERYSDRLAPDMVNLLNRFNDVADLWQDANPGPAVLAHADFRNDNLLWSPKDAPNRVCYTVDWQTLGIGPPGVDVGYFLGGSLLEADRRAHEKRLVKMYHDELLKEGIEGYTFEQAWDHYRAGQVAGMMMAVVASQLVVRTERGDEVRCAAVSIRCWCR